MSIAQVPDLDLIRAVLGLGLGAVIAMLVLLWKRGDDQRYQKNLETIVERQDALDQQRLERDHRLIEVISTNNEALRALKQAVESESQIHHLAEKVRRLEENDRWRNR